jgi:hypothetical protein
MTLPIYTAFCQEANGTGTIWVDSVRAKTQEKAGITAIRRCADAWKLEPDQVVLLGLIKGNPPVKMWDDSGYSIAELEKAGGAQ